MKKGKILALAGVALLATGVLAACSNSTSNSSNSSSSGADQAFNYIYEVDP